MQGYLHEIWYRPDDNGHELPACIALGPACDDARKTLIEENGYCVWVFGADSHLEAMNIYYQFVGYGKYQSHDEWHSEKYPEDWYKTQNEYIQSL